MNWDAFNVYMDVVFLYIIKETREIIRGMHIVIIKGR